MNIIAVVALLPHLTVPEPIYNLGQFLLGLFYLLGAAGGRG